MKIYIVNFVSLDHNHIGLQWFMAVEGQHGRSAMKDLGFIAFGWR